MIVPTVGRVVLFKPGRSFTGYIAPDEFIPAFVCKVYSNTLINVGGFDAEGHPFRDTSVRLLQDNDLPLKGEAYCQWMPYQKAVAAGTIDPVLHEVIKT